MSKSIKRNAEVKNSNLAKVEKAVKNYAEMFIDANAEFMNYTELKNEIESRWWACTEWVDSLDLEGLEIPEGAEGADWVENEFDLEGIFEKKALEYLDSEYLDDFMHKTFSKFVTLMEEQSEEVKEKMGVMYFFGVDSINWVEKAVKCVPNIAKMQGIYKETYETLADVYGYFVNADDGFKFSCLDCFNGTFFNIESEDWVREFTEQILNVANKVIELEEGQYIAWTDNWSDYAYTDYITAEDFKAGVCNLNIMSENNGCENNVPEESIAIAY